MSVQKSTLFGLCTNLWDHAIVIIPAKEPARLKIAKIGFDKTGRILYTVIALDELFGIFAGDQREE